MLTLIYSIIQVKTLLFISFTEHDRERISRFFAFHPYETDTHTSCRLKCFLCKRGEKKSSYRAIKIKCPDKIIDSLCDNSTNDIFQRDVKRVTIYRLFPSSPPSFPSFSFKYKSLVGHTIGKRLEADIPSTLIPAMIQRKLTRYQCETTIRGIWLSVAV